VGGVKEKMCDFEFGVGDVKAREVCLNYEKKEY
jgi:hypothetical protein